MLVGDLNTTPWSHSFAKLIRNSGLRDTAHGWGFQWSWPSGFSPLAIPIDHCLVSPGVRVLDRFTGPDVGSDHYPLVVDVALSE